MLWQFDIISEHCFAMLRHSIRYRYISSQTIIGQKTQRRAYDQPHGLIPRASSSRSSALLSVITLRAASY